MSGARLARERELVRLAAHGPRTEREEAFAELYAAFREPVAGLCRSLCAPVDADDALQETFCAVLAGLGRFRGESGLSTWIYRIAIRSAVRVRARSRRHVPVEPARERAATDAEDPLVAREERERIDAALARLSLEHRLVLALSAVEGLPQAEVARIVGVAEGTVWSRLCRARKRLATELAGGPVDPGLRRDRA